MVRKRGLDSKYAFQNWDLNFQVAMCGKSECAGKKWCVIACEGHFELNLLCVCVQYMFRLQNCDH